ncbi:MAG: hypothetical protein R3302_06190 [Sulfurimonadaceae bacterium]|nr:hypothetical protein [Sulfurimonadaceae bacterium]
MLDFSKFTKYSKPGPRYTSYPTALEFSDAYTYEDYLQKLQGQGCKSCGQTAHFLQLSIKSRSV